jgi:hypothetical protein
LNLVLSIGAAACAMGLYSNRINYTGKAVADGTQGKIKELADKINQRYAALSVAQARFDSAPSQLFGLENVRSLAQNTYRDQIALLNSGDKNNLQETEVKDGVVVMDPKDNWLPKLKEAKDRQGAPMQSIAAQLAAIHKTQDAIKQTMVAIAKAHKDNGDITNLLIGDKGLRERLAQEYAKSVNIEETIARRDVEKGTKDGELRTRTRDYEVERALLSERNKQLTERVKELEKTGVARQP